APKQLHRGDIGHTAVSPDARWIVTVPFAAPGVFVWDAKTLALVKQFPDLWGPVRFSPKGRWMAAAAGDERLWRAADDIHAWVAGPRLNIPGGAFEFSPDGQLLAVSTKQGQLYLFDLEGERELAHFEDPELRFGNLTFSPDGSRLIAVHGNGVHV